MKIDRIKMSGNTRFTVCVACFLLGIALSIKAILSLNGAYVVLGIMLFVITRIIAKR